jgi:hypothetical protein
MMPPPVTSTPASPATSAEVEKVLDTTIQQVVAAARALQHDDVQFMGESSTEPSRDFYMSVVIQLVEQTRNSGEEGAVSLPGVTHDSANANQNPAFHNYHHQYHPPLLYPRYSL